MKTSSFSILVRSPNWIGDQILAYPFFYYLRKNFPNARITVACVSWVADIQFRDLVDEIIILPKPEGPGLWQKMRAVFNAGKSASAQGKWDLGISLPNSFSSAVYLYLAKCRRRRGYRTDGRTLFLNEGQPWEKARSLHRSQAYLELLPGEIPRAHLRHATEFWGVPAEDKESPDLPGEEKSFNQSRSWPARQLVIPVTVKKYWVLAPGATADSRRWPLDRFGQLVETIHQKTGWRGIVVGGPKETEIAEWLCSRHPNALVDYTAQGSVSGLAEIFRRAQFTVCNESGLAHVASLCGSKVHIVCGAADPRRTRPIGPGPVSVTFNPVECWPCEKNICLQAQGKQLQCLLGITSERVWEEIHL